MSETKQALSLQTLTAAQREVLRVLVAGAGRYEYEYPDDMEWIAGDPKSGWFAQKVTPEATGTYAPHLTSLSWRLNTTALRNCERMGLCERTDGHSGRLTPIGWALMEGAHP